MKNLYLSYIIFLFSIACYSQEQPAQIAFWKLTSLKGEFNLKGAYWNQTTKRNTFFERLKSSFMSGGLFLNTKSYFYHPNFLEVEVDAGFSPETGQRLSLLAPDQYEVNTLKKLYTKFSFIKKSKVNLNVFANINEGYSNRENLTNIKTNTKNWGSSLYYKNKFLPLNIHYNKLNSEQLELQTNRFYKIDRTTISGKVNSSFGLRDKNDFIFSHDKNIFYQQFSLAMQSQPIKPVKNNLTTWRLTDNIYFDKKKNYIFNSIVSNENQVGNFNYQRFQILENLFFKLPWNLKFYGNYSYFDIKQDIQTSKENRVKGSLSHKLYKSINTNATFEYNTIKSTEFSLTEKRASLNIKYDKNIPLNGHLRLTYNINSHQENRNSKDALLTILNEEYTLTDGKMVLLKNQNINVASVLVKDITGTILYELNFDYILIKRNELLEIQRIPGGKIGNNTSVFIDYLALQPGAYQYNAIHNIFSVNLSFFKNKIYFYYRNSTQDFLNPINIKNLTLDYFNQHLYGSRFNFGFISGGIEQDNYKSTIIPYRLTRYFLDLQGSLKNKLLFSINGTIRDYQMIIEEGTKQQFYNISGNIGYIIGKNTKLNLSGSYRKDNISNFKLNVITSKLELSTRFNQIFIITGFEIYNNKLSNENLDYKKVNVRITRKF